VQAVALSPGIGKTRLAVHLEAGPIFFQDTTVERRTAGP
jgi:hypothetical protein